MTQDQQKSRLGKGDKSYKKGSQVWSIDDLHPDINNMQKTSIALQ